MKTRKNYSLSRIFSLILLHNICNGHFRQSDVIRKRWQTIKLEKAVDNIHNKSL